MSMISSIISMIERTKEVAIIGHINPDGDTLGSCLALGTILRILGFQVDIFCEDNPPEVLRFLTGSEEIKTISSKDKYELVMALDCSDMNRMGSFESLFSKSKNKINIDHHISNTNYADINWVDPSASATGELVYDLISALKKDIGYSSAEALYVAISTDTGSFSYSNTTPRTHQIAAELLGYGLDVSNITTHLYMSKSLEWTRLLAMSLNNLELHHHNKLAMISISKEILNQSGAKDSDTDGIIDYARNISGVEVGVLLREVDDNIVRVGFRSKSKVDVSLIASTLGGGGHKKASGCTLHANLEEAKTHVLDAVGKALEGKL